MISVITVNLNNELGLLSTIESVAAQTYNEIEYIIVDGGSKDGSLNVIKKNQSLINHYLSEADNGIYHAMNKGVLLSKGEYILFLNSGDTFYDGMALETLVAANENNNFDLIYGNIKVKAKRDFIKTYPTHLDYSYFRKDTLPHPATLIKATRLQQFPFDDTLKIVSDWKFFMIGILKNNFTYKYVNSTISIFYTDGLSSINPKLVAEEKIKVLKEEFFLRDLYEKFKKKMNRLQNKRAVF